MTLLPPSLHRLVMEPRRHADTGEMDGDRVQKAVSVSAMWTRGIRAAGKVLQRGVQNKGPQGAASEERRAAAAGSLPAVPFRLSAEAARQAPEINEDSVGGKR